MKHFTKLYILICGKNLRKNFRQRTEYLWNSLPEIPFINLRICMSAIREAQAKNMTVW